MKEITCVPVYSKNDIKDNDLLFQVEVMGMWWYRIAMKWSKYPMMPLCNYFRVMRVSNSEYHEGKPTFGIQGRFDGGISNAICDQNNKNVLRRYMKDGRILPSGDGQTSFDRKLAHFTFKLL